jgi:hypothetical protein
MTSLGSHLGRPNLIDVGFIGRGESSERDPRLKGMKFRRHFVYHLWEGVTWKHFRFPFLQVTGVPKSRNRYKVWTTEADIRGIIQDNAGQHLSSGRTKLLFLMLLFRRTPENSLQQRGAQPFDFTISLHVHRNFIKTDYKRCERFLPISLYNRSHHL